MSKVACVKVNDKSTDPKEVFDAVRKAMELAGWEQHVKGKNIVLKVNVVWDKIYPSCTTTPMVIEGVLKVIKGSKVVKPEKITVVDTNTAAFMSADVSFEIQGINAMAKRYGAEVINLSNTQFREVELKNGLVLKKLKISKVLLDADSIITLPVMKTHSFSTITGGLKNQWGCIHDLRLNFHMVLNKAIADVNTYFKSKVVFGLMDGLFGMEGKGPKTGIPRKIGYLLASSDLVALDSTAAEVMGFDPASIRHIMLSEERGVGSTKKVLVGDPLPHFKFLGANGSNLSMGMEMWVRRRGKWAEWLMFSEKSPLFFMVRLAAKIFNDGWYYLKGVMMAKKMMQTNFGIMWKEHYLNEIEKH